MHTAVTDARGAFPTALWAPGRSLEMAEGEFRAKRNQP